MGAMANATGSTRSEPEVFQDGLLVDEQRVLEAIQRHLQLQAGEVTGYSEEKQIEIPVGSGAFNVFKAGRTGLF